MKIEVFSRINKEIDFEHEKTLFLKTYALNFCKLDSTIAVTDISEADENLLSLYNKQGELQGEVGKMYKSKNPSVRHRLSRGIILCSEKYQRVLNAFYFFPYIYSYSYSGDLVRTYQIDDFDVQRVVEKDQGRTVKYSPPSIQPFHSFGSSNLVSILEDYFLAQVRDLTNEAEKLDSYLISFKTGESIYMSSELPLISSAKDSLLIAIEQKPFAKC